MTSDDDMKGGWRTVSTLDVTRYTAERHPQGVYQALLDHGVFALPRCRSCAKAHYSPRVLCPHCGSEDLVWEEASGRGALYSVTWLTPKGEDPYCVALVDLAEGPRLMTNIIGSGPDDVSIGMPVRVCIGDSAEGKVPFFETAGT